LLVVVLTIATWVFLDARSRSRTGVNVVATVGPITLETPGQWLAGSLLLWVFVVPLYLVARRP